MLYLKDLQNLIRKIDVRGKGVCCLDFHQSKATPQHLMTRPDDAWIQHCKKWIGCDIKHNMALFSQFVEQCQELHFLMIYDLGVLML